MRGSCCLLAIALCVCPPVQGGVTTKLVREAAEQVMQKLGKETAGESLETVAEKIGALSTRHGDEAALAVQKVGPRAIALIENAGADGTNVARLLAKYGDDATWIASKSERLSFVARFGDDAAEAMIKHGEIAEPLLKEYGEGAATALRNLSGQSGRRLTMMARDGDLDAIGRTSQLLTLVSRQGDRAMDFIWKHKGSLTVSAALVAFLANPEPFLDGAIDLTAIAAENVAKPTVTAAGSLMAEIARSTNWTLILLGAMVVGSAALGFRHSTGAAELPELPFRSVKARFALRLAIGKRH